LSQTWKVATLEFDIGEDLYFPIVIPCLHCYDNNNHINRNNKKVSETAPECNCNYAAKRGEGCGTAPEGCPKCNEADVDKYCKADALEDWTELKYSSKDDYREFTWVRQQSLVLNQMRYYRLYVTDPCRGYFVKLFFDHGMADLMYSSTNPQPSQLDLMRNTDYTRYPDHIELLFCPDDPTFRLGTLFFGIVGRSPNTTFDLAVFSAKTRQQSVYESSSTGITSTTNNQTAGEGSTESSSISSSSSPSTSSNYAQVTEDLICEDDSRFYCLKEGVDYEVNANLYRYDYIATQSGECAEITVFLHCFTGDGDLFGAWDTPDPAINYLEQYQASLQGSDVLYNKRCFDRPGTYTFYFNIDNWDPGLYYVSVSTMTERNFLIKAIDVSPYQYGYLAARYMYGVCPSVNLSCVDWGFSCQNSWSIYPSNEPEPFWPIPPIWVRHLTLSLYRPNL